jgi:hypothetical protein
MRSYVDLVDFRSGNVLANYPDEGEAWMALRRAALEFGLEEAEGLGLVRIDGDCETLIAMDDDLVQCVARDLQAVNGVGAESRAAAPRRATP